MVSRRCQIVLKGLHGLWYMSDCPDIFPSAVYLSPVQTPPPSNDGNFMFFVYGVR